MREKEEQVEGGGEDLDEDCDAQYGDGKLRTSVCERNMRYVGVGGRTKEAERSARNSRMICNRRGRSQDQ